MQTRLKPVASLAILLIMLSGCHRDLLTSGLDDEASFTCQMVEPSTSGGAYLHDEQLADLHEEFGGTYYNSDEDILSIYMLDPSDKEAARRVQTKLSELFAYELGDAELQVLQAKYTAAKLNTWKDRSTNIMVLDGVIGQDLDEAENRLTFMIDQSSSSKLALRNCIYENAANLDIPKEAVLIKEQSAGERH